MATQRTTRQTATHQTTRRRFLGTVAAAGGLAGWRAQQLLAGLPVAEPSRKESTRVQFGDDIEPIVRPLEDTPRDRVLDEFARRIRDGLSYQEVIAALLLAGVRNVQPRPSVGFKFHAVLVVNSAHLASLASPDKDRWLPVFWALDYFKSAQARDVQEGNWTMQKVDESAVPSASNARQAFVQAMERWDEDAADAAIVGLARTAGANEVFELFYQLGCRDFRSIGHKAIFVSNAKRTLDCIGWHHAEPVLRSLAYALLNHQGEPNPATSNLAADQSGRRNQQLASKIGPNWLDGEVDHGATSELLAALRSNSSDDACDLVVQLLNRGTAAQSIWDALLCGAGELLMRQPGIVALHAVTSSNALRYAFATSGNEQTRKVLMLQNAAFLPLFRQAMGRRGSVSERHVDQLRPAETEGGKDGSLADIFEAVSSNRGEAASMIMQYLQHGAAESLIDEARRLVFLKGDDAHDYKYSSAVLEDYYSVSPPWRNQYLATAAYRLPGTRSQDNQLVARVQAALA